MCNMQTAVADAEKRQSELSALQREHQQAKNLHAAALKEVEALHAGHASAAQRAEEAIAELALVRETQAALTAQVLLSLAVPLMWHVMAELRRAAMFQHCQSPCSVMASA